MAIFKKKQNSVEVKKPWYREWSEALIVAVVLAMIIRTFLFQAFKIPSGSMLDTLLIGDHLLVNKFIFGTKIPGIDGRYLKVRNPERGDVIVFEFPGDEGKSYFERRDFIKRVIGLPGDVIEVKAKQVFVNGEPFTVPYEIHKDQEVIPPVASPRDFTGPIKVPEDSYFVMGDNRDFSYDSRFWGYVHKSKVKGLAFIKYWSWNAEGSLLHKIRFSRIGRLIN
ncbi:signal peptidase I Serine peptidase. MEROPS family S26A [Desulfuromusa kysingii]|uniref:Signal peptidase I n=1 Tax=Desulfuromusa kysingii TaxID=37625 RepID=A0A1H4BIW2_9BACT|nr:signal peptidase I [Desulfuromusa kysingii]SEA48081.1 signal peptidase I Serine peptidase. MEROPS family S26A [Desulfuromusa kysingii]